MFSPTSINIHVFLPPSSSLLPHSKDVNPSPLSTIPLTSLSLCHSSFLHILYNHLHVFDVEGVFEEEELNKQYILLHITPASPSSSSSSSINNYVQLNKFPINNIDTLLSDTLVSSSTSPSSPSSSASPSLPFVYALVRSSSIEEDWREVVSFVNKEYPSFFSSSALDEEEEEIGRERGENETTPIGREFSMSTLDWDDLNNLGRERHRGTFYSPPPEWKKNTMEHKQGEGERTGDGIRTEDIQPLSPSLDLFPSPFSPSDSSIPALPTSPPRSSSLSSSRPLPIPIPTPTHSPSSRLLPHLSNNNHSSSPLSSIAAEDYFSPRSSTFSSPSDNEEEGEGEGEGEEFVFDPSTLALTSSSSSLVDYLLIIGLFTEKQADEISSFFDKQNIQSIEQVGNIRFVLIHEEGEMRKNTKRTLWKVIKSIKLNIKISSSSPALSSFSSRRFSESRRPLPSLTAASTSPSRPFSHSLSLSVFSPSTNKYSHLHALLSPQGRGAFTFDEGKEISSPSSAALINGSGNETMLIFENEDIINEQIKERERRRITGSFPFHLSNKDSDNISNNLNLSHVQALQSSHEGSFSPSSPLIASPSTSVHRPSSNNNRIIIFPISKYPPSSSTSSTDPSLSLRLTPSELWICKGENNIISSHSYSDIFCLTLKNNNQTICISFNNDEDIIYYSEQSLDIYNEINERKKIIKEEEGRGNGEDVYTQQLQRLSLSNNNIHITNRERGISREVVSAQPVSSPNATVSTADSLSSASAVVISPSPSSSLSASAAAASLDSSLRRTKISQLTGLSDTARMGEAINRILLDEGGEEGKSRIKILRNINNLRKNPSTFLSSIRQYMDSMKNYMEKKRMDQLRGIGTVGMAEEQICKLIELKIEMNIVLPLYTKIIDVIRGITRPTDDLIHYNIQRTKNKSLEWWGISQYLPAHSPTSAASLSVPPPSSIWNSAVYQLSLIDKAPLPSDKLLCILNTAKAIYSSHLIWSQNQSNNNNKAPSPLAGDDFFPIFVYVVANGQLESLESIKLFCWGLCEKNSLNGEAGYYLTVFEAAVEHLKSIQPNIPQSQVKKEKK